MLNTFSQSDIIYLSHATGRRTKHAVDHKLGQQQTA